MVRATRYNPVPSPANNLVFGLLVALLGGLFDQWTKHHILAHFMKEQNVPPIHLDSFLQFILVWNRGVSFGMFSEAGTVGPIALMGLAVVLILVLVGWLWTSVNQLAVVAIGLIIGGAVGNLIDRVRFGAVVDFIDFYIGTYHWPAFNVADSLIFIGVVLLIWESIFLSDKLKGEL